MENSPTLNRLWAWLRRPGAAAGSSDQGAPSGTKGGATLKQLRAKRREGLFAVVRENMIRGGVLSSTYKFKVLTLDPGGEQFIVMMDWQPGAQRTDTALTEELERGLQAMALERVGVRVKAVYWRGGGLASAVTHAAPVAAAATPAPIEPEATPETASAEDQDPDAVSDEELKAFRAALAQGTQAPAPSARPRRSDGHVDFQPTVINEDPPVTDFGSLSETQYGKLR